MCCDYDPSVTIGLVTFTLAALSFLAFVLVIRPGRQYAARVAGSTFNPHRGQNPDSVSAVELIEALRSQRRAVARKAWDSVTSEVAALKPRWEIDQTAAGEVSFRVADADAT